MSPRLLVAAAACLALAPVTLAHHTGETVIYTVAGGVDDGFSGDGGPATRARLRGPVGLALDSAGGFYVADTINQRVRHVDGRGRITTVAGTGRSGFAGDGGPARAAQFQDPTALAEGPPDGAGVTTLYVADTANDRIRAIRNGTVTTFAGSAEQGFAGDAGPARAAQLNGPQGVAAVILPGDRAETVFIADTGNHRIRAVDPSGTIRTIAGNGTAGYGGDGGPAGQAALRSPTGVERTVEGLLIADSGNNRVRLLGHDGRITTVAGTGAGSSGGDGGPAAAAALNAPADVAALPEGGFLVVERGGNRVRAVDASGTITRYAGAGGPRSRGDGGSPVRALLNAPAAVSLAPGSGVLIADTDGNRVRYATTPTPTALLALAPRAASVLARLRRGRVADVRPSYQLSRAAVVRVSVAGRRGRALASFRAPGRAGLNRLRLPPRLRAGRRRLVKGFYRLTLTARAGGATAVKSMELVIR